MIKGKKMKIFNNTQINELSNILKNDGVIAVPTDTVYGLCARMNSRKAREHLIEIKHNLYKYNILTH